MVTVTRPVFGSSCTAALRRKRLTFLQSRLYLVDYTTRLVSLGTRNFVVEAADNAIRKDNGPRSPWNTSLRTSGQPFDWPSGASSASEHAKEGSSGLGEHEQRCLPLPRPPLVRENEARQVHGRVR